ncbi:uncharacterized protein LOC135946078 [Cloeon dipterum]|uniref:uncharacterized protein LOC135946078 n=1 Tax=Cloeon dipterum TaxID=197152 RepID=UPI0032205D90
MLCTTVAAAARSIACRQETTMRLRLLALLCLAVCAAQASDNERDDYFPAPYFDKEENLSSENCGNQTTRNHWDVFVRNMITEQDCVSFIAFSKRTILGEGRTCEFGLRTTTDLRVFPKICEGRTTEEECIRVSVKVVNVIDLTATPLPFTVIITEDMPSEVITPLCLFNRDNLMDFQLQRESPYFVWTSWTDFPTDPTNVTSQSNCKRVLSRYELEALETSKIPIKNILCVEQSEPGRLLINYHNGRYFLRGVDLFWRQRSFIDVLPYIDVIARFSKEIYVLRPIPQTKEPSEFIAQEGNLSFPDCGRKREIQPSTQNSNGVTAHTGDHPWNVYIENVKTGQTCGGTLISPTVVLTAAHCLYESKAADFKVTFGMYDKRQRRAPGVQRREINSLIVHPKYDSEEVHSDVGLIILRDNIQINDHVRPICLWNDDSSLVRVAGTEAMAVGFGLADNHARTDELQEARLPIIAHKECYLSERRFFGKFLQPGDNFCAGYKNGTINCNGDSGGSLSVEKDGRWYIRGIVSFGKSEKVKFEGNETPLCPPNQYSLFADVASYMDWIVENTPEISFRNSFLPSVRLL